MRYICPRFGGCRDDEYGFAEGVPDDLNAEVDVFAIKRENDRLKSTLAAIRTLVEENTVDGLRIAIIVLLDKAGVPSGEDGKR